jgi:hypothetical protein
MPGERGLDFEECPKVLIQGSAREKTLGRFFGRLLITPL